MKHRETINRERHGQRHTERLTDRQTETERQTDGQTDRERERDNAAQQFWIAALSLERSLRLVPVMGFASKAKENEVTIQVPA